MSRSDACLLTVRDAAGRLGVTPRTLKYYEERGLITPIRSEGHYRLYDEADLERFARILRLRALGFSLHGITEMLKRPVEAANDGQRRFSDDSLRDIQANLAQRIATLSERIVAARRELREVEAIRAELRHDLDYVEQRLAGGAPDRLIAQRQAAARGRSRKPRP